MDKKIKHRKVLGRPPISRLWPWNPYDRNTWKYIDYVIKGTKEDPIIFWILNPNFKYKHLDPEQQPKRQRIYG